MLFDSHAHLNDERFDEDRHLVIKGLPEKGIAYVLNAGADLASSRRSIELADQYDFIYASVGIHPHDTEGMMDQDVDRLQQMAQHSKVVAIGEIGLDYYYDQDFKEMQKKRFIEQLELAGTLKLPVIIHDREAHGDILEIIKNHKSSLHQGGVMHCYSGSWELAKTFINLGFYISLGGTVTFKNAVKTVEVAKNISLQSLLIETDSPYLAPHPYRGKRNDSSLVKFVAEKIAEIKGLSMEEVAQATLYNAITLFNIDKKGAR